MSELAFPARGPGHLPFSTADVRDQCSQFAPDTGFPLPGKHVLMMCTAIDELRARRTELEERLAFWVGKENL